MESVKIQLEELFSGLQVPPTFPPDNRDVPGNDSRETTREPHTRDELRYRTLIENLPIGLEVPA